MNFTSIRIEGAILSADLLDKIARDEYFGQRPVNFGNSPAIKVKDEMATTWARFQDAKRGKLPAEPNMGVLKADLESMRDIFFDDPPRFKVVVETLKGWEEFFNRT